MAARLRILHACLSSARHCQSRGGLCASSRILNKTVSIQRRQLSDAAAPPYEEFNVQSTEDFNERVMNSKIPTVVDFHASWCKPCHVLAPRLQEVLAERQGRVQVQLAKVDVDQHTDLAMEFDVSSIPKVLMIKEGKIAGQFIGLMEKDKIESFVDRLTS